jgi:hypothetical protein
LLTLGASVILLAGCGSSPNAPRPGASRTWQMGFAGTPQRLDFLQAIAAINMWSTRADAALISYEPPWDSLLAGVSPESLITRDRLALVQFYRSRGFRLVVMLDPGNGLDRAGESTALVAAGRSITEPAVRQLYRRYAVVADSLLRPDEMGVVLETNLIRAIAPAPLYQAIRQAAVDAAADVRALDASVRLMVSVQVETAWGRLPFTGVYAGVEQDFTDFPFVQTLGLSSYPYFAGFPRPEDIPLDYYSRLAIGHAVPVMITEGGWTSADIAGVVTSTPAIQRSYLVHQARLLTQARATALFQLTFTDLDLAVWPPSIAPFAHLGLVDPDLVPKPALSAWDSIFALPRLPY